MTSPSGPIEIDNVNGSDTAASGLGPASAVSGTGASTDGTSTVDLSADTPDLSGVSAGDMLWVDSSSGRKFSVIASVDDGADTVTCDDAFSNTESGRNWGIGGERKLLDNNTEMFTDSKAGWIWNIQETGTDYEFTASQTITAGGDKTDGYCIIRSDSATRPTIGLNHSSSANWFFEFGTGGDYIRFQHLKFDQTSNTPLVNGLFGTNSANRGRSIYYKDCEITQASSTQSDHCIRIGANETEQMVIMEDCYIHDCGGAYISRGDGREGDMLLRNRFKSMGAGLSSSAAIYIRSSCPVIQHNVISGAAARGIELVGAGQEMCGLIEGNTVYNSTTDGIGISTDASVLFTIIQRNILVGNGGYGIDLDVAGVPTNMVLNDWNAYYNNTSGRNNGVDDGANDLTLTADPFVDAASGDFNINNTAGGGAALRTATLTITA